MQIGIIIFSSPTSHLGTRYEPHLYRNVSLKLHYFWRFERPELAKLAFYGPNYSEPSLNLRLSSIRNVGTLLFSVLPSNSKLNLRLRHLSMTENHKYISNSDDLKKTCGKEQTLDNDSEQRWRLTYFHLRAKSFIFCCSLQCEKILEWFRLKTKLNWVISMGRCTSPSWYKTNLTTSSRSRPISSWRQFRVIFMMTPLTAHLISLSQETRKVEADGGFCDTIPAWPLSPCRSRGRNICKISPSSLPRESPGSYISRDPVYIVWSLSIRERKRAQTGFDMRSFLPRRRWCSYC